MLNEEDLEKVVVRLASIDRELSIYCYNEYKVTPYTHFLLKNMSSRWKDCTVLDFGAGTGIIAIACYYLHAKGVYAYDINRIGLDLTQYNIAVNNAEGIIIIHNDQLLEDLPMLDILLCNPPSLPCEHKTSDFFYGGYFGTDVIYKMIDIASTKLLKGGTLEFVLTSLVSEDDVKAYLTQKGFTFLVCDRTNLAFRKHYFDLLPHFCKLETLGKCSFLRDSANRYFETISYVKAKRL